MLTDQRTLLQNPDFWPLWPYLPLTRKGEGFLGKDTGTMIDHPVFRLSVFKADMYETAEAIKGNAIEQIERIDYASVSKIMEAGWTID